MTCAGGPDPRAVADQAFVALINAHRATSGYAPLPDTNAVRRAYMASPNDGMGERWLEHERRKSDAAVAAALAASESRAADAEARAEAAERRVGELEKALEPFAAYAELCHVVRWLSGRSDEERLLVAWAPGVCDAFTITMGHFRAAARARAARREPRT